MLNEPEGLKIATAQGRDLLNEPEGLKLQQPRASPWVGIKINLQPEGLPEEDNVTVSR